MATREPNILVSVQAGETQMGFMRFLPGQPVAAITVGLDGNWRIVAPGVGRAHLSLLFDGQALYAAALGPDLQVFINGAPIDGRWWMLKAPAELRFGHACLRVFAETPSSPAPIPRAPDAGHRAPEPMGGLGALPTRLDGAGEWESQKRDDPQPIGTRTQLYDPSMVLPRGAPPARGGSSPPANRSNWPPPQNQPALASSPEKSSRNPVSYGEPPMASTLRRPLPGEQGEGAGGGTGGLPVAMAPTMAVDASAWIKPPNAKVMPGHGHSPVTSGQSDQADDARPAGVPGKKGRSAIVEAWRSASIVKRVIFLLLPLAFAAVLWPESAPPPPPAPKVRGLPTASVAPRPIVVAPTTPSAPVATANPQPTAPLAGTVADAGLTPSNAEPSAAPTATAAQTKPPAGGNAGAPASSASADVASSARPPNDALERIAIDAAFAGRWRDAVGLYDRLAAARPEDPAFREAARIIREEKLRTK
jgi:hypothetical protein